MIKVIKIVVIAVVSIFAIAFAIGFYEEYQKNLEYRRNQYKETEQLEKLETNKLYKPRKLLDATRTN